MTMQSQLKSVALQAFYNSARIHRYTNGGRLIVRVDALFPRSRNEVVMEKYEMSGMGGGGRGTGIEPSPRTPA